MRAIGLLAVMQLRNAFRTTFTDGRKLMPLLFFAALFALQIWGTSLIQGLRAPIRAQAADFLLANLPTVQSSTFLILLLMAVGNLDFGFSTGFLHFNMADVDYLFPSPVRPKAILAYRLASKTVVTFFQAAFLFAFFFWGPIQAVAGERTSWLGGAIALGAIFLCLGGYANLALWLKLAFGFGGLVRLRPALLVAVTLFGGYLLLTYWQQGVEGMLGIARSPTASVLFFPCRVAADAVVAPLLGSGGAGLVGPLAAFYLVTLAMVFLRNDAFYEASLEGSEKAARLLQAARELNWGAILHLPEFTRRSSQSDDDLRGGATGFGRGGWTVFLAHVTAAGRRPVANVVLPVLGGVLLSTACTLAFSPRMSAAMVGALGGYLLFVFTIGGITTFRQALARHPLIRPLPLKDWQVVVSDVAPRIVLLSLFAISAAFAVLMTDGRQARQVAFSLAVFAPAALVPLNLIQYALALWYPNAQDKLHQLVGGMIGVFVTGIAIGFLVPLAVMPLAMRLHPAAAAAVFGVPCLGASAVLLALSVWLYGRFEDR